MAADFNQLDNFFLSPKKEPADSGRLSWRDKIPSRKQFLFLPRVLNARERRALVAACFIAIVALFAMPVSSYYHGTAAAPASGGSWSEALVGTAQHINPLLAVDIEGDLAKLVYAGLVRYDHEGNLKPELAESYTVSSDGLEYSFRLRENLTWHDGEPLTADDVVYTITTAQNAEYASPQRVAWQGVEMLKGDDRTVTFKLKNRYAQFLQNATLGILPKHIWEPVRAANFSLFEKNLKPVGSGPYKFSKLTRTKDGDVESMQFAAFDGYALARPHISKITFRFYRSEDSAIAAYNAGDVDGLASVTSHGVGSLQLRGQLTILPINMSRYFGVFFNQSKSKLLSDKQVRLALSYATDKQVLIDQILNGRGTPVDSPLLPGLTQVAGATAPHVFDLARAQAALDARSVKDAPLSVELTVSSNLPELSRVAQDLKEQWAKIGIEVKIRSVTISEIRQSIIKDRDYEALLFGEGFFTDPDPFDFWHSSQKRDPGKNLALYDNPQADRLLEEARQTLDVAARYALYARFQDILIADAPAVLLYSPQYLYVQPKKIKGNRTALISSPANRFDTVHEWYIDTERINK